MGALALAFVSSTALAFVSSIGAFAFVSSIGALALACSSWIFIKHGLELTVPMFFQITTTINFILVKTILAPVPRCGFSLPTAV